MTITITRSAPTGSSSPALALGYQTTRNAQTIVHPIIGRAEPDVTLRPAALRTGTLRLFFLTEATAHACELMHASAATFTIADTDRPTFAMRYVPQGAITRQLEDGARRFVVEVGFQEISP